MNVENRVAEWLRGDWPNASTYTERMSSNGVRLAVVSDSNAHRVLEMPGVEEQQS